MTAFRAKGRAKKLGDDGVLAVEKRSPRRMMETSSEIRVLKIKIIWSKENYAELKNKNKNTLDRMINLREIDKSKAHYAPF